MGINSPSCQDSTESWFYLFFFYKTVWNRTQWAQQRWADQLCLADWSVMDTFWWHWCLWGGWPDPALLLAALVLLLPEERRRSWENSPTFCRGEKTQYFSSGHVLAELCVVRVSWASAAGMMFPKSFPMELPSSAPAASEPLWGGRCGGAVDSLANRAAWKKEKGEKK